MRPRSHFQDGSAPARLHQPARGASSINLSVSLFAGAVLVVGGLAGCHSNARPPGTYPQTQSAQRPPVPPAPPGPLTRTRTNGDDRVLTAAEAAERFAAQAQAALAAQHGDTGSHPQPKATGPRVVWVKDVDGQPRQVDLNQTPIPQPRQAPVQPGPKPKVNPPAQQVSTQKPPAHSEPAPVPTTPRQVTPVLDRATLIAKLAKKLGEGHGPKIVRALNDAALSLMTPHQKMSRAALAELSTSQRRTVDRYHRLLIELARQIASSDGVLTRAEIDRHMDHLFGSEPLSIDKALLCRKVQGYGVITEFAHHRFLAGTAQPVIVYVELSNFKVVTSSTDPDQKQVLLRQELTLYNKSDGLRVWQQEPVRILDESRNARRDFFVVQKVVLPRTLGVGKYQLKVHVHDINGRTVDETNIPIEFVAQQTLVGEPASSKRP